MKCLACGQPTVSMKGVRRLHDAALDQKTRLRVCRCTKVRATVEIDAGVLSELRRKAYVHDMHGMGRKVVTSHKQDGRERWSDEDKDVLRALYPTKGVAVAQMLGGKTKKACESMAARMGIRRIWNKPKKPRAQPPKPAAVVEDFSGVASVFDLARM